MTFHIAPEFFVWLSGAVIGGGLHFLVRIFLPSPSEVEKGRKLLELELRFRDFKDRHKETCEEKDRRIRELNHQLEDTEMDRDRYLRSLQGVTTAIEGVVPE